MVRNYCLTNLRILGGMLSLKIPRFSPRLTNADNWLRLSDLPGEGGPELVDDVGDDGIELSGTRNRFYEGRKQKTISVKMQ